MPKRQRKRKAKAAAKPVKSRRGRKTRNNRRNRKKMQDATADKFRDISHALQLKSPQKIYSLGSLPASIRLPFRWEGTYFLPRSENATPGRCGNISWRLRFNSIYYPDYDSLLGGYSAYGWQTFQPLYDRYKVVGATIEMKMETRDASSIAGAAVNLMMYTTVSDYFPVGPTAGGYSTEGGMNGLRNVRLPRGTGAGALYAVKTQKCSRSTNAVGTTSNANAVKGDKKTAEMFHFKHKQVFKKNFISRQVNDPIVEEGSGTTPFQMEGVHPLSSRYNNNPQDTKWIEFGAIGLPHSDTAGVISTPECPALFVDVKIDFDTILYAPRGVVTATAHAADDLNIADNFGTTGPLTSMNATGGYQGVGDTGATGGILH